MHTQRQKGIHFELEICKVMRGPFPPPRWEVKRGLQCRDGRGVPDVMVCQSDSPVSLLHIECKHGKQMNPRAALAQAVADHRNGALPIAIVKDDGKEPFAVLPLDVLVELLGLYARDHDAIQPVDTMPMPSDAEVTRVLTKSIEEAFGGVFKGERGKK